MAAPLCLGSLESSHKLTPEDCETMGTVGDFRARFKFVAKLGSGGFADVVRVTDLGAGGDRALKQLRPATPQQAAAAARAEGPVLSPEVALFREARALKHARHPNVVALFSVLHMPSGALGSSSGSFRGGGHAGTSSWALLLEFMQGGSLAGLVMKQMTQPNRPAYSNRDALAWGLDIAAAVAHIHGLDPLIIHRDLKLENVMLTAKPSTGAGSSSSSSDPGRTLPVAKLTDFGLHVMLERPAGPFLIACQGGLPVLVLNPGSSEPPAERAGSAGSAAAADAGGLAAMPGAGLQAVVEVEAAAASDDHEDGGDCEHSDEGEPCACRPLRSVRSLPRLSLDSHTVSADSGRAPATHALAASSKAGATGRHVRFGEPGSTALPVLPAGAQPWAEAGPEAAGSAPLPCLKLPSADAAAAPRPQAWQRLTVSAIRRLSLDSTGCAPGAALSARSIPLRLQRMSPDTAPGEPPAAVCSAAAIPADLLPQLARAEPGSSQAAAPAGGSELHHILASANAARDPLVSLQDSTQPRSAASSYSRPSTPHGAGRAAALELVTQPCGSPPASPGAASSSCRAGAAPTHAHAGSGSGGAPGGAASAVSSGRSLSGRSVDFPTAASMLWEDMVEDSGCQELLDSDVYGPPPRLAYDLTQHTGSCMYMAPEVFRGEAYNEGADVFSLGCVLFELFSRNLLLFSQTPACHPSDATRYADAVARGYRPDKPRSFPEAIWQIVARCWAQDSTARPSAAWVLQQLQQLADAEDAASAAAAGAALPSGSGLGSLFGRSKARRSAPGGSQAAASAAGAQPPPVAGVRMPEASTTALPPAGASRDASASSAATACVHVALPSEPSSCAEGGLGRKPSAPSAPAGPPAPACSCAIM